MPPLLDELRRGIARCDVRNERLLVAVSGGADSVALLQGLVQIASECALSLHVAHLNHRLRGPHSDADAEWVDRLAASLNLPCEIGVVSEGQLNAEASGLEENARTIRYQFLDAAAKKNHCQTIALAHTADDQVETVLHHLLRGTGIAGLRGIPLTRMTAAANRLVRPILGARRADVESYLSECGQTYRIDDTNIDTAMTRNRIRHVVLPMLRDQVNPQVDVALFRLAEQAIEIDDFLFKIIDNLLQGCVIDQRPDACRIDVTRLKDESRHLIRSFFCELWNRQNWPRQAMGFDQWNRLAEIIQTRETITLPNRIEARFHSENLLVLRRK